MKKLFSSLLIILMAFGVSAQENKEAFRHLSIGAEAGLHGFGVEVAMPVSQHFVLKAGYNWFLSGDLFKTNVILDTEDLLLAQEQYTANTGYTFQNYFEEKTVISSGVHMGLGNYKLMLNWYPFTTSRFYFAGGLYLTPSFRKDDAFFRISGYTTAKDWAALNELNERRENPETGGAYQLALTIDGKNYAIKEKDGCGYLQADFTMNRLKYYLGFGVGRCVPDKIVGLQFEVGAMIYRNAKLYCQGRELDSILDVADGLGTDSKEIVEYIDKYPIYPQLTMRLSFRAF